MLIPHPGRPSVPWRALASSVRVHLFFRPFHNHRHNFNHHHHHVSPAHVISPYLETLLYDPSISITSDSLADRTLPLQKAIIQFCYTPESISSRTLLTKSLLATKSQIPVNAFAELLENLYFIVIKSFVATGNTRKCISVHDFFFSSDIFPNISQTQWLGFVKSMLRFAENTDNESNTSISEPSHSIVQALYQVHCRFGWKNTFEQTAAWMYFDGKIPDSQLARIKPSPKDSQDIKLPIQEWIWRLFLGGDLPTSPWQLIFLERLLGPNSISTLISLSSEDFIRISPTGFHLYRQLVHSVRAGQNGPEGTNTFISALESSQTLHKIAEATLSMPSPFGFHVAAAFTRAIPSLPPYFWCTVLLNKQIKTQQVLNLFKSLNRSIPEKVKETLVFRESSLNSDYNKTYKRLFNIPPNKSDTELLKSYANTVRVLCKETPEIAHKIMQDPIAYKVPEIVKAYLTGLQETNQYNRLCRYVERTLAPNAQIPAIYRLFWPYYLLALTFAKNPKYPRQGTRSREALHYLFAILGAKANIKMRTNVRHSKDVMPLPLKSLATLFPLNGVPLTQPLFDRLAYRLLIYGRTNTHAAGKKPLLLPLAPLQLIKLLRLAFAAKTKASQPKYQLSPYRLYQYLDGLLYGSMAVPRSDLITFLTKLWGLYPADVAAWKTTHPGTRFAHEYLSAPIIHHIIYIGILLSPSKPWWVLAMIRQALLDLPESSPVSFASHGHLIKETVESVLARIYTEQPIYNKHAMYQRAAAAARARGVTFVRPVFNHYYEQIPGHELYKGHSEQAADSTSHSRIYQQPLLAGPFRNARSHILCRFPSDVLSDALNMIWEGVSMKEVDAALIHKGIRVSPATVYSITRATSTRTPRNRRYKTLALKRLARKLRIKKARRRIYNNYNH
ncbi:uncharacterized protein SAPINGB_P005709 [Magnusiomyces paraingens]|uniref:Uncharacterized protein n=1 Tax=Magnusiomyces paraingens TaxID=2606893 RepID=A0A5E8C3E3_9ASCO|nr:uncharacterized protein SAPINGB_P005709 [Saprochaete ingens]VVT57465.1 unnamed protein product [Saprochaete ingens]